MPSTASESKRSDLDRPAPAEVVAFLSALFDPLEYVLVRPVETWTDGNRKKTLVLYQSTRWQRSSMLQTEAAWQSLLKTAESNRANLFMGTCPRVGGKGHFDLSWQIRTVRVLWADLDHCTPAEAVKRCADAKLPPPSTVVNSGSGTHLYWLLAEPFLIDDVAQPPAVLTEWIDQGPDKKKLIRKHIKGENGERVYLYLWDTKSGRESKVKNPECPWGSLSPKALHVQDVLAGLASKIGGDHTTDLARSLRLPGTLNRKDHATAASPSGVNW